MPPARVAHPLVDGTSGKVVETIPVGEGLAVVAAVDGDVWVTNFAEGTVWRIAGVSRRICGGTGAFACR